MIEAASAAIVVPAAFSPRESGEGTQWRARKLVETFKTWTAMETILSVVAIALIMLLSLAA